jgi:hypothetical protein
MKAKHEDVRSDTLFYCFVDFGADVRTPASVYVIPSPRVAEVLAVSHRKWLATPGRNGQAHNDTPIRRLLPDYTRVFGATGNPYPKDWLDPYRDAWHLLNLEAAEVEQATTRRLLPLWADYLSARATQRVPKRGYSSPGSAAQAFFTLSEVPVQQGAAFLQVGKAFRTPAKSLIGAGVQLFAPFPPVVAASSVDLCLGRVAVHC